MGAPLPTQPLVVGLKAFHPMLTSVPFPLRKCGGCCVVPNDADWLPTLPLQISNMRSQLLNAQRTSVYWRPNHNLSSCSWEETTHLRLTILKDGPHLGNTRLVGALHDRVLIDLHPIWVAVHLN